MRWIPRDRQLYQYLESSMTRNASWYCEAVTELLFRYVAKVKRPVKGSKAGVEIFGAKLHAQQVLAGCWCWEESKSHSDIQIRI